MISLYASKWVIDFNERSLNDCLDTCNKLLQQAIRATQIREENKQIITAKIKDITLHLATAQRDLSDLNAEISLAMKLHEADFPESPEERYFVFDANGTIRKATKQEYDAVTPADATTENNASNEK